MEHHGLVLLGNGRMSGNYTYSNLKISTVKKNCDIVLTITVMCNYFSVKYTEWFSSLLMQQNVLGCA